MRRFLVLTILLALVVTVLCSHSVFAQYSQWNHCANGLPPESEFPAAEKTCKKPQSYVPWYGTPHEIFTLTGFCVLKVNLCGGKTKCWRSEIRKQEGDWCKDFKARYDWLANSNRTICCDPKCEKPTPWFGSSPGCRDVQSPMVEVTGNLQSPIVTLYICGIDVFHDVVTPEKFPAGIEAYKVRLADFVKQRIGSKVCCDKLREAVRTKQPCDPTDDIDCDGKINTNDFYVTNFVTLPDIDNVFGTSEGAKVDPFPRGLNPDDPNFLPPQDKCDCKWQLAKGTLTCSRTKTQPHLYEARWLCPSTGNEYNTNKKAPAEAPCGTKPETNGSFLLPPDRQYINGFGYSFLESFGQDRTRVPSPCETDNATSLPTFFDNF